MKIFFDTEFTGLHQNTTIVSIGLVSEDDRTFYAEFTDYDKSQITKQLKKIVIKKLLFRDKKGLYIGGTLQNYEVKGNKKDINLHLRKWLSQFHEYEFWNDCLSYDWILLADLIGGIDGVTEEDDYYYPNSFCSIDTIKGKGFDAIIETYNGEGKNLHNALYDAKLLKKCFELTYKEDSVDNGIILGGSKV
jgi:hypothetical protein